MQKKPNDVFIDNKDQKTPNRQKTMSCGGGGCGGFGYYNNYGPYFPTGFYESAFTVPILSQGLGPLPPVRPLGPAWVGAPAFGIAPVPWGYYNPRWAYY